jgi:PTS system N-acetylglucosamine-specific IIC component
MYRTALPKRRKAVGGLLMSMALTSFFTGVTEPIEFTFMFLAPTLFAVHAALTGAAMVTMDLLQSHLGFGFSAGLFDYVLNYNRATHPLYLIPVGALYFALYYFLFRYCILRFDLGTPGREADEAAPATFGAPRGAGELAGAYVAALGGATNLREVSACTTRLRLELADRERVDRSGLRQLGVRGTVDVGASGLQVVVGPMADNLAGEIRAHLAHGAAVDPSAQPIVAALGGALNIASMQSANGRVLFEVRDGARVDRAELQSLVARGVAFPSAMHVHLLHASPQSLESAIAPLLG